MEEVFVTLGTEDVDMKTKRYLTMIEPNVNRNFVNIFHRHNFPNKRQHLHKPTGQKYQSRPLQISKNFSPPYLKGGNWSVELKTRNWEKY